MSRRDTLREWVRCKASSLFAATRTSKTTTRRYTTTQFSQTADGQPSSEATLTEPPHCPACTCHTPQTIYPPSSPEYLAYNPGEDPNFQAWIRAQALEAATDYVGAACAASSKAPKALKTFSRVASRLKGEYDLGFKEYTRGTPSGEDEYEIALSAAFIMCELGRCPTSDEALGYLVSNPAPLLRQRLIDTIDATQIAADLATREPHQHFSKNGRTGRRGKRLIWRH